MIPLSPRFLNQIYQLAQEVPASTRDSLVQFLMTVNLEQPTVVKQKLMQLLPQPSWRQTASDLLDCWQSEAREVEGQVVAIALATAAHCQAKLRQELSAELVWTGPNPDSLPLRRTDQALLQLIRSAQQELLIVSFAIYNIPEIVQALVTALNQGVSVRIVAETPEASQGKVAFGLTATFGSEILERAQVYVWPKEHRPVDEQGRYGSLHAKCAISDRQHLFISSANLTEYAMSLNIEMGLLVHNSNLARQVNQKINGLISYNILCRWLKDNVSLD